jgi:carbon monoxide dehydrogenase subunit G
VRLENAFHVSLPVDEAWALLTDLPAIAPCLPGAHLDDVVDGEYRGGLSTKIGPITARYQGSARFTERDDVDHRGVIEARGREERGSGTASATVTAALRAEDSGTRVDVTTELAISGRAAQFGRSLMAEVTSMLLSQFVSRLETMIQQGEVSPGSGGSGGLAGDRVGAPPRGATPPGRTVVSASPAAGRNGAASDGAARTAEPSDGAVPVGNAAPGGAGSVGNAAPATVAAPESLDVVTTVVLPLLKRAAAPALTAAAVGVLGWAIGRRSANRRARSFGGYPFPPYGYAPPYTFPPDPGQRKPTVGRGV